KRVDDHAGGDGHQRRHEIKRAGAALDEPQRSLSRPSHRGRDRVRAHDKTGEEEERAKSRHWILSRLALRHFGVSSGLSFPARQAAPPRTWTDTWPSPRLVRLRIRPVRGDLSRRLPIHL